MDLDKSLHLDTIVFERLNKESEELMKTTLVHLGVMGLPVHLTSMIIFCDCVGLCQRRPPYTCIGKERIDPRGVQCLG